MPFRSTAARDDEFVAVTRRRFSPFAALGVLFLTAQIVSVAVALVSLGADNPVGSAGSATDRMTTQGIVDHGSMHSLHAGGCRIIGEDASAVSLERIVR